MDVKAGLRVVRGPDWKWGNQDGGEGHVGTVVEVRTGEQSAESPVVGRAVVVQWDVGNKCNYRCGINDKYDLLMFDNGPTGIRHEHIICDSCRQNGLEGIRWKCIKCFDYDLCSQCYQSGKHSLEHEFMRIDTPDSPRARLPVRKNSRKILAKGLFKNAQVVRGQDWLWGDQDGGIGKTGKLIEIRGWEKDTFRSVAEVEWKETKKKNVYRVGHKGKVDVKCSVAEEGGCYYPEHLAVLGRMIETAPQESKDISAGDLVRVQLDVEVFKALQQGHGGWNDAMVEMLGQVGTVHTVLDSNDLRVSYPNNRSWTVNPAAVTKITQYSAGDPVRIIDDMAAVHDLQEGHGGWVDDMALSLGQVGRVIKVFSSGDVRVGVNNRAWTFNPLAMNPAPGENPPEVADEPDEGDVFGGAVGGGGGTGTEDLGLHLKLLSLLENPAVVVAAAASGDVDVVREYLSKHSSAVNFSAAGKCALHCASASGNIPVMKCLLEFKADIEKEDDDGDRAIHICAFSDEDEATQVLLDSGADVNARSRRGLTPLNISAAKGNISVLKILLKHPKIDLHVQDDEGDTALHNSVLARKNESVSLLMEHGADPKLVNFRLFTAIHEAGRIGFYPAIEQFMRFCPDLLNLPKDDGYTALHLSALNDHLDVLTALIEHEKVDVDCKTHEQQTPLHLAAHKGNGTIVERLVGFGANLNVQDKDGDTPLHIVLMVRQAEALTEETPQLMKVQGKLNLDGNETIHNTAAIACFLIQEGANQYLNNNKGLNPLEVCPPELVALIVDFNRPEEGSKFHGSLRCPPDPVVPPLQQQQPKPSNLPPVHATPPPAAVQPAAPIQEPVKPVYSTHPLASPPPPSTPSPLPTNGVTTPPSQRNPGPQSRPVLQTQTSQQHECILCDAVVDICLKPCGHAVLCRGCASRAKKCPQCRVPVECIEELACPMCQEEAASVTMKPCGHRFCHDCARRQRKCFDCKQPIVEKEGLRIEEPAELSGSGSASDSSPASTPGRTCSICCTNPIDTALFCGHQLCYDCSKRVDHCPVCRKFIQHRIRLFTTQ